MNQTKSVCPGCRKEVVFELLSNVYRCPLCGFQYEASQASQRPERWEAQEAAPLIPLVLKVLLFVAAIIVVGAAVAFAGCALVMGGFKL